MMGMFDYLVCDYPLPDELPEWIKEKGLMFQTKSLGSLLDVYTITEEGHLLVSSLGESPERLQFHGDITFYTSNVNMSSADRMGIYEGTGPYPYAVDLRARFTEGVLTDLWVIKAGTFAEGKEIIKQGEPRKRRYD